MSDAKNQAKGFPLYGAVGLLLPIMLFGYVLNNNLEAKGFIPHVRRSTIAVPPSWNTGETRTCTTMPAATAVDGKDRGYALDHVLCGANGGDQKAQIKFYGLEYQPNHARMYWSCKRSDTAFTCKQTGAL